MKRRFRTEYFYDARYKRADTAGFPRKEEGSLRAAGRELFSSTAYSKVRCVDRHTEKVLWEAVRTRDGGIRKTVFADV